MARYNAGEHSCFDKQFNSAKGIQEQGASGGGRLKSFHLEFKTREIHISAFLDVSKNFQQFSKVYAEEPPVPKVWEFVISAFLYVAGFFFSKNRWLPNP